MKSGYLKLTIFILTALLTSLFLPGNSSYAGSDGTITPDEFQELAQHCEAPQASEATECANDLYDALMSLGMTKSDNELELFEPILEELKGPYASEAVINIYINNFGSRENRLHSFARRYFRKIRTDRDIEALLKRYARSSRGQERAASYILLIDLVHPEDHYKGSYDGHLVDKFSDAYYEATENYLKRRLFGMLARHNNEAALDSALSIFSSPILDTPAMEVYYSAMGSFSAPELEPRITELIFSEDRAIRFAASMMIRNYPSEENIALIKEAIQVYGSQDDYEKAFLESTLDTLTRSVTMGKGSSKTLKEIKREEGRVMINDKCNISPASTDEQIATRYAPQLKLSGKGIVGVNLNVPGYPYQDYLPIHILNLASLGTGFLPSACHGGNITPLTSYWLARLGDNNYNFAANSVDLKSIWAGEADTTLCTNRNTLFEVTPELEDGYRALDHRVTYYYKVFRNSSETLPTAVQYWFFSFYNDWMNNHPGDWETITVFLDAIGDPKEAVYSTHNEAKRHSWGDLLGVSNPLLNETDACHPIVNVANGGHGSYAFPDNTFYLGLLGGTDNHWGDKEALWPEKLIDLTVEEAKPDSSVWFKGRWGNTGSTCTGCTAPRGPIYRTDAPSSAAWTSANNPPVDPLTCKKRLNTSIYGNTSIPNDPTPGKYYGPWKWAEGYILGGLPCGT